MSLAGDPASTHILSPTLQMVLSGAGGTPIQTPLHSHKVVQLPPTTQVTRSGRNVELFPN